MRVHVFLQMFWGKKEKKIENKLAKEIKEAPEPEPDTEPTPEKEDGKSDDYTCQYCGKVLSSKRSCTRHEKTCKKNE